MKRSILVSLAAAAVMAFSGPAVASDEKVNIAGRDYVVYDISKLSADEVEKFQNDWAVLSSYVIDNKMIVSCRKNVWPETPVQVKRGRALDLKKELSEPFLATRRGKESPLSEYADRINVIYEKGPYTVFQAPMFVVEEIAKRESNHFKVEKFDQKMVLRMSSKHFGVKRADEPAAPAVTADKERIKGYIQTLQDLKTRYTYSQGYEKSYKWAAEEFKKIGFEVKISEYADGSKKQYNVVAQKSFAETGNFYIVCGHLDSTSNDAMNNAPGADDNASGSAGVLEVANLVANSPHANKFRFVLFAGEEVGMKGSNAYVRELKANNELAKVTGVVNFDMIGFDRTPPLSTLFETREFSKPFITHFMKECEGKLKVTVSYNPWGSDHMPFLNAKIPCFLFIEDEFEDNPNYHKTTDLLADVNLDLSTEFARTTAATLLKLCAAEGGNK